MLPSMAKGWLHVTSDMTAGDLVVGIGTLALALFTGLLARRTKAEVKINEEQIALSREGIEALDRPFVFVSRKDRNLAAHVIEDVMHFSLTNLGKGPGIVHQVELLTHSGKNLFSGYLEDVRAIRPAPSDSVPLEMRLSAKQPVEGELVTLRVWYRSASNVGYVTDSCLELNADRYFRYRDHRRVY
jgi:hypothetical protein